MAGPALALRVRQFRVPRRDSTAEECEDFADCRPDQGRFAVADGAAESFQSGLWARLLVEDFLQANGHPDWVGRLRPLQDLWAERVGLHTLTNLPWFMESQVRQGAFATFLGLTVGPEGWSALAVG